MRDDPLKCFDDVAREVTQLPMGLWTRLAFAAACAERLLPVYTCYTEQQDFDANPYFTDRPELYLELSWGDEM